MCIDYIAPSDIILRIKTRDVMIAQVKYFSIRISTE